MQRYLFVLRHPPHQNRRVLDTLDMLLTTAAFDQPVALLFLDEGVWQLKQRQQPQRLALPDSAAWLKSLPLYGVDQFWVEQESLDVRGLSETDLFLPVNLITRRALNPFLRQQTIIVSD